LIQTPRLLLRPHGVADFEAWAVMFQDESLFRFIGAPRFSQEDAWNRLLRYAGHWSLLGFGLFAVFDRQTREFRGEVGFADFHRGLGPGFDDSPEAAWIMTAGAQGRGLAHEAVAAAHAWLDEAQGFPRTVCIIHPDNAPSIRLAQKLGYAAYAEGRYRDAPCILHERLPGRDV
jgi:RimJ/RimL family protein N-acetyltransferase